jgi:predicted transcriptional regulator
MEKFWRLMLEKAIQHLLKADWTTILSEVRQLMSAHMTGREKAEYALSALRRFGSDQATWLLKIGIEVAYSIVKREVK